MSASPNRLSLLLPAYLNGTLSDAERRWVDEQLAASPDARAELEELRLIQGGLRAHWESEAAPSPSARARVMAAIAATPAQEETKPGLGARLGAALSALFAPKWVPAAALSVIVLQFALLVAMNTSRTTVEPGTRGGGNLDFPTRLTLVLQPDARQGDLTMLLQNMRAQVIAGPDASGTYILGLRTDKPEVVNERLALARARSDLVVSVDVLKP
jgi:hypothetical protein